VCSSDLKSIACIAVIQKKYFVLRDSAVYGPFDMAEALTWSPDSRTLVFVAIRADNWITVKNGEEILSGKYTVKTVFNPQQKKYEYMVPQITPPVFSPDSRRLAFIKADGFRYRVCVDGQNGPPFDSVGTTVFSPDSRHYAYIGIISQEPADRYTVIYDGSPTSTYDMAVPPIVFSPDSKRMAFRISRGKDALVVTDGRQGRGYGNVGPPAFSPDSQKVAYKALKNGKTVIVVDEKEDEPFYETTQPCFGPQYGHVAYLARADEFSCFLVVNGKKTTAFSAFLTPKDEASRNPIVFDSPNRLHFIGFFLENERFSGYRVDVDINTQSDGTP